MSAQTLEKKRFVFYYEKLGKKEAVTETVDYPEDDLGLLPSEMEIVGKMSLDEVTKLSWGKVWRVE